VKVGNLVKRRSPKLGKDTQLGIVIDLEMVQYAQVAKVQWLGADRVDYPPLMYRVKDLKVFSEAK